MSEPEHISTILTRVLKGVKMKHADMIDEDLRNGTLKRKVNIKPCIHCGDLIAVVGDKPAECADCLVKI